MRSTVLGFCLGSVLFCAPPALAKLARSLGVGSVTDVGPEAGLVWLAMSQPFLFRGQDEVLVTSGRAGVYKSLDGGQSWVRGERGLLTPEGVEPYALGFCQSRSAPDIAYLITIQDGISRTADFGESFEPLVLLPNANLSDCAVDPADPAVVYTVAGFDALQTGVLFKSTDAGRTFSRVGAGLETVEGAYQMSVAPTNPQVVYVSDGYTGDLYVSSDGGLNFRLLPNAPAVSLGVYAHPTDDGTLFVVAFNDGLFRSTDGGDSFARAGAGLPAGAGFGLAFDPSDSAVLYVPAGAQGLFRSTDGGLTFERVNGLGEAELLGAGVTTVGVSPADNENPPVVYAGTSLGPFRSEDAGATFVPIHTGYRGVQVEDFAIDAAGRLLVAAINSVGVFRAIDSPGSYQIIGDTLPRAALTQLQAVAAAPDNPDLYLVAVNLFPGGDGAIFRTDDGGRSWSRAAVSLPPYFSFFTRIAFAPSDSRRVYVSSGVGGLLRSDDGGESFQQLQFFSLGSIAVDPGDPNLLYVGSRTGNRGLFKSADGGRTLQQLSVRVDIKTIALDPKRPQVLYAGLQMGTVIRSLDGGQTFALADRGLSGDRLLGLGADPRNPMRLLAWMHAGGLFRTEDGADSWSAVDTGETLRRSTAQAGGTSLIIDRADPTSVYVGNGSILQFVSP